MVERHRVNLPQESLLGVQYLAVTNRLTLPAFLGMLATHEIRLYRIDATDGSLSQVGTRNLPLMGVSGLDFSPDGQFLYFIRTTVLSGNTAMRMEVPALSTPQVVLGGATEVRRTIHGHMLLTKQQDVYTVTDPDAPVLLDAVNSTAVIWACPDPILFPHVALQPIIIHNERPVAYRHIGRKHYELSDHLGNVRVVVSDLKLSSLDMYNEPGDFVADVVSRTDYYGYGAPMPKRNYTTTEYAFGYNGMLKDDEIHGTGNSYTAEFWQYDTRVAHRWNMDPVVVPSLSPYASFVNNPIYYSDPKGDCPWCIGGLISGLLDAGLQLTEIALDDSKNLNDFSWKSVGVSALSGAAGIGIATKVEKTLAVAKLAYRTKAAIRVTTSVAVDAAASAAGQYAKDGKVDARLVAADVIVGAAAEKYVGRMVKGMVDKTPEVKTLQRGLDRAERMARGPSPRQSRVDDFNISQRKIDNYIGNRVAGSTSAASGLGSFMSEQILGSMGSGSNSRQTQSGGISVVDGKGRTRKFAKGRHSSITF